LCFTFLACSLIGTSSFPCNIPFYPEEAQCNPQKGVLEPIFTEVRGRGILRTST